MEKSTDIWLMEMPNDSWLMEKSTDIWLMEMPNDSWLMEKFTDIWLMEMPTDYWLMEMGNNILNHKLLPSHLLHENVKFHIYRNTIFPAV